MNTEIDLIAPRIKVIAPGPLMENKVGSLLKVMFDGKDYSFGINTISSQHFFPIDEFKQWPYIFKILEWWEDREESQMPEYLKFTIAQPVSVEKVSSWALDDKGNWWVWVGKYFNGLVLWDNRCLNMRSVVPATKEEFENNQTFKNKNV